MSHSYWQRGLVGWPVVLVFGHTRVDRSFIVYSLLAMVALVAGTYPRADVAHLNYVAPLPYVLAATLCYHHFPARLGAWIFAVLILGAMPFLRYAILAILEERRLETPIGEVRVSPRDYDALNSLLSRVRPGEGMYVHPYKPLLYFLTRGRNPTRYSYFNPGMMTDEQVQLALAALSRYPPEWVLYLGLTVEAFLRVFPSGKPEQVRLKPIEEWIFQHYEPVSTQPVANYVLMRRRGP